MTLGDSDSLSFCVESDVSFIFLRIFTPQFRGGGGGGGVGVFATLLVV